MPVSPLPLECITAQVIDTIKGKHFRQCDGREAYVNSRTEGSGLYSCISFDFSPYWKKIPTMTCVVVTSIDAKGNVEPPSADCYGTNSIRTGGDYIVFLKNIYLDNDSTNTYFTYWPFGNYSMEGGIFEIDAAGNVQIPSDFFGYGKSVPLSRFKELIRRDITTITAP
jgi:hypothetical protein